MPKTKLQNVVFTAIMAIFMVYGMIVYNVALNTGFILEFFVVDKVAHMLAFSFMKPDDRPQHISYAISWCICCVMCPIMSLIATILFKEEHTFAVWIQTWGMNLPAPWSA